MGFGTWLKRLFGGGEKGEECIACSSQDLTFLAEEVYHCNACGYEGGSGMAAYLANQKKQDLQNLDNLTLLTECYEHIDNARLALLSMPKRRRSATIEQEYDEENDDFELELEFKSANKKVKVELGLWSFDDEYEFDTPSAGDEEERRIIAQDTAKYLAQAQGELATAAPHLELLLERGLGSLSELSTIASRCATAQDLDKDLMVNAVANSGRTILKEIKAAQT